MSASDFSSGLMATFPEKRLSGQFVDCDSDNQTTEIKLIRDLRYIRPMHQLCGTAPRIKGRL